MAEIESTTDTVEHQRQLQLWSFLRLPLGIVTGMALSLAINEPVVGGIVAYILASWRSFIAATWLLQFDPNRRRALVCFVFYIANAFWTGAFLALPTVFASAWMMKKLGQQVAFEHFKVSMIAWVAGVVATTIVGLWAIRAAIKSKLKVWVHPKIKTFADDEFENLSNDSIYVASQFNYAIFVVATAVVFPLLFAFCFTVLTFLVQPPFGFIDNVVVPIVFLFVLPLSLLILYGYFSSRIVAQRPSECWPNS